MFQQLFWQSLKIQRKFPVKIFLKRILFHSRVCSKEIETRYIRYIKCSIYSNICVCPVPFRVPLHMSAEPKRCFLNYPKGGTYIFQLRTTYWFRGYVSSNQIHLLFGTCAPKIGQKGLKMGLKCLVLEWYGLVWLVWPKLVWSEKINPSCLL